MLIALVAGLCAFALPSAPAFGEGSVDINLGPAGLDRQGLEIGNPSGSTRTVLQVYAQPGETIQMAHSVMGFPAANILLFAPGDDPATATPVVNCAVNQPGSGQIASRAEEVAGPLPNAGGYDTCDFVATTAGSYTISMLGTSQDNGSPLTVGAPNTTVSQGRNASMWDVTVRAGGAVQDGRVFSRQISFRTGATEDGTGDFQAYVYTNTGYEYQLNLFSHAGANWVLAPDDLGVVDAVTGDRKFASFACGDENDPNFARPCIYFDAQGAPADRRYPVFFNRVDPLVISGPGGLGETLGYSSVPISPGSSPLANTAFTGSAGQSGATNRGAGGTISFTSPAAMEGLGYTLAIDTNRDGTFGNGSDFVDATSELESDGTNAYAWNGLDAQGNVPACGDYPYQIRSSLSEVHFPMFDVESSAGTRIERLSLPSDPVLGHPLAASYNNVDPYKNGFVVTNGTPPAQTNAISGDGFNAWTGLTGNTDWVDTWTRLPEVATSGMLRLLCADPQVVKSSDPAAATPGEDLTFRVAVTNNGPDTATDVVATDDLPDSVQFKSASQGCAEAAGVVTCSLASLAAGATHTFEIVVAVPSSLDECIENSATVTNSTVDTNLANNNSSICVPLNRRSDLSIAKDPSRTQVGQGGQVMFTLVVENDGPSDDPGVDVSDPLAPGLTLVAADPSQGTCTTANNTLNCDLGGLKEGGSAQVLVTAQLSGTQCVTNTARVRGANIDPTPANNQDDARVCPTPDPDPRFDLVVTKTANDRSVVIGQPVTYRIVVRNNGPAAAPDVTQTDTLNAPVSVVSVKSTAGSCEKRIPMRCELGTIAAGDSVTITIVAKHREAGCKQRQAASATGNGTDVNPANNMDTVDVCVKKIRLKLSKVASRSSVAAGDTLSYRIRVRNPTKGEARKVKVCDRLPSGLSYVSSNPNAKRQGARQHCWTIKRLGAGKSRTFHVTVRAARGAIGRKVNTATLSSPDISKRLRAKDPVRVRGIQTPLTG